MATNNIHQQIYSSKTAEQAQKIALEHLEEQMKTLKSQIAEMKKIKSPDWGNVGDTQHTIELLEDAISFLNNEG